MLTWIILAAMVIAVVSIMRRHKRRFGGQSRPAATAASDRSTFDYSVGDSDRTYQSDSPQETPFGGGGGFGGGGAGRTFDDAGDTDSRHDDSSDSGSDSGDSGDSGGGSDSD